MQEEPVLSIGAVLGDSDLESMVWMRAIGALSKQAMSLGEGLITPVRLSVVYHVDGRLSANEFEGVRTGRFNKRSNSLVVQAAVLRAATQDKRTFLLRLLGDVIDEAERYVQKKGLAPGLPEIRGILGRLI
jgi:hypothetical protein